MELELFSKYRVGNGDRQVTLTFRHIQALREKHLEGGGNPVDFPDYLKEHGISVEGNIMHVPDSLITFLELKDG